VREIRREQWRHVPPHGGLSTAAFSLLLPVLGALVSARFRLHVRVVPALIAAVVALEFLFRWTRAIPPAWLTTPQALSLVWLSHVALSACIVALAPRRVEPG
jgi:hypothetical protein